MFLVLILIFKNSNSLVIFGSSRIVSRIGPMILEGLKNVTRTSSKLLGGISMVLMTHLVGFKIPVRKCG